MKSRRWLRIIYRILIIMLVAVGALYWAVSRYVSRHQDEIIRTVSANLNEQISGDLKIGSVTISLFQDFPDVSIVLHHVSLQDSLFKLHRRPVLQINEARVEVSPVSLLSGSPDIQKICFINGDVDMFTDSTGYSNISGLFLKKNNNRPLKKIPKIGFSDIRLSYSDTKKKKLFEIVFDDLDAKFTRRKKELRIAIQTVSTVKECNFNTDKGSFLKNKALDGRFQVVYSFDSKRLDIPKNTLKIDKTPMQWKGNFSFATSPVLFNIQLNGEHVMFYDVAAMLSPAISSKLSFIKVHKPVDLSGIINGRMQYRDTPEVYVSWRVRNNDIMTPVGKIDKTGFEGYFSNYHVRNNNHSDKNSIIVLKNVKANWLLIPFRSDSIKIYDLQHPYIECNVNAAFSSRLLNPIIGGESFLLGDGRVMMDINYKGRLKRIDSIQPSFNGYLSLEDASLKYLPRNLFFKKCNALLQFRGADIIMKNVMAQTSKSTITMDGVATDFFTRFSRSPDSIQINWNVKSGYIDFSDFNSFLQPRKRKNGIVKNSSKLARNLDKVLDASKVNLCVRVDTLNYRQFTAKNIMADIVLRSKETDIQQIILTQSGGTIQVTGNLKQQDSVTNKFGITADVQGVDVGQLFYSFENFGQDALSSENLRGMFSAHASAAGLLQSKGRIVPNSITGTVDFELVNGALVHFKPFERVGKTIFKKRNLSNVVLKKVSNTFTIDKNKVIIPPMLIESSALNIKIAGVFGFDRGTDISLEIPLKDPRKYDVRMNDSGKLVNKRGLILYLKAIDDGTGNVKITWDRSKQHR